jgi:hypothetical protein
VTAPYTQLLRAFVAAPVHQNLDALNAELNQRGITIFTAYELPPASSLAANIEKAIRQADLVVAVIPEQMSPNVFFELGMAHTLRKPIILLVSPQYGRMPSDLAGTFYLRADPENREAIGFALDQCLSRIEKRVARPPKPAKEGRPLGADADRFLALIQSQGPSLRGRKLENLVAEILRAADVNAVTQSPTPDRGADIAVWSDALESVAGNPLLIEIKSNIHSTQELLKAANQVERYRIRSGSLLALLIVNSSTAALPSTPTTGGVLAITLERLIGQLRGKTFAETIRELRNEYSHGGKK